MHQTTSEALTEVIVQTHERGGRLVIPSFAIGRVEELLYWLQRLEKEGRIPSMPTYVDSPMAAEALQFYSSRPDELDPEMHPVPRGPMFDTRRLHVIKDTEESKALTRSSGPAIIISSSGMATGGRVLHHLKSLLPDPTRRTRCCSSATRPRLTVWCWRGCRGLSALAARVPRPIGRSLPVTDRKYLLDARPTAGRLQVYADGFEALSLRDKLLAYHLAQAAIAGRDIYLDQRFASGLALRWVLESLYVVKDKLEPAVAKEVDRYCKLFWVHSGIHDNLTTQKTLLNLSWEQFSAACDVAQQRGIDLSMRRLAPLADLREAYAIMTDPKTFRSVTDKSTEDGNDPIAASCNNLYVGVSSQDLANFEEKNGLNSRLKKEDGVLKEEVYRCGDGHAIAPGRYAEPLARVNEHLRQALAVRASADREGARALMRYNQTGDLADWRGSTSPGCRTRTRQSTSRSASSRSISMHAASRVRGRAS